MAIAGPELPVPDVPTPDASRLVTEDSTPVDNLFSEKQMRLLTEPLYASWSGPGSESRGFLVASNVAVYATPRQPPVVPDVLLSIDVTVPREFREKEHRSYFMWDYGKPPEVVIEIVSNSEGNELGSKLRDYARMKVSHYVVFDPNGYLGKETLRIFRLDEGRYQPAQDAWFGDVELALLLWEGTFEGQPDGWLRWCDRSGVVVPTGAERAETEHTRAETEHTRAETEHARAERLAARLRALGADPDSEG